MPWQRGHLGHISSLFQSKIELYIVRILVGAHITPNKPSAWTNAKIIKGGVLLLRVTGPLSLEGCYWNPHALPLYFLKSLLTWGPSFYEPHRYHLSASCFLFLKCGVTRWLECPQGVKVELGGNWADETRGVPGENAACQS